MTFVKFITPGESFPGRSCCGSADPAGTAANCRCGWKYLGPHADATLCWHLYGDLSPAVRQAAIQGLP